MCDPSVSEIPKPPITVPGIMNELDQLKLQTKHSY
jgi:hypothetical protein